MGASWNLKRPSHPLMLSEWRERLGKGSCSGIQVEKYAFVFEQPTLSLQSTSVACQGSVRTDDAVARHDDGDGIGAIGYTYGADGFWPVEFRGELAIADCAADTDAAQGCPDFPLERRASGFNLESVDRVEVSIEVRFECAAGIRWFAEFNQSDSIGAEPAGQILPESVFVMIVEFEDAYFPRFVGEES
jgi:hypothetical protein